MSVMNLDFILNKSFPLQGEKWLSQEMKVSSTMTVQNMIEKVKCIYLMIQRWG